MDEVHVEIVGVNPRDRGNGSDGLGSTSARAAGTSRSRLGCSPIGSRRRAEPAPMLAFAILVLSLTITSPAAAQDAAAWAALAGGGHVALIRHGNAPPGYGGDPPGFKIDDCATQRNLDETGRQEARALGEAFRKHGVRVDRTVSSPWCRCLETARLMAVGEVESSWSLAPDLNS